MNGIGVNGVERGWRGGRERGGVGREVEGKELRLISSLTGVEFRMTSSSSEAKSEEQSADVGRIRNESATNPYKIRINP